jgi:cytochrome c oxidase subunit III
MSDRPISIQGDVSDLPTSKHGAASLAWWGNSGFMAIEGIAFLLAGGSYLYLMVASPSWPPKGFAPPELLLGVIFTVGLLLSEMPNRWLIKKARAQDERAVRIGIIVMSAAGFLLFIPRALEFTVLGLRWDENAYGSVLWLLMILHTVHLVTDWGDTLVLALWLHTHEVGDRQFADVEDNGNYWRFVELSWLPIYALVYWAPRLA